MDRDILAAIRILDLKVLTEFDSEYQVWASRCLETGAIATGDTPEAAESSIKNTLEFDIVLAIRANDLKQLIFTTASPDVRERWYYAKAANPDAVATIKLDIPLDPPRRGVQTEFTNVKIREHGAA